MRTSSPNAALAKLFRGIALLSTINFAQSLVVSMIYLYIYLFRGIATLSSDWYRAIVSVSSLISFAIGIVICVLFIAAATTTPVQYQKKLWMIGGFVSVIARIINLPFSRFHNLLDISDKFSEYTGYLDAISFFLTLCISSASVLFIISFVPGKKSPTKLVAVITLVASGLSSVFAWIMQTLMQNNTLTSVLSTISSILVVVLYYIVAESYHKTAGDENYADL